MNAPIEIFSGGVITGITDVCRNFPVTPQPNLAREALYDVINKAILTNRIVVLEGEPLSGKSECAAELMRRSPNTSIGIFLNSDLGIFNSTSYVRLVVAEQVAWILDGIRLPEEPVTEEQYQHLIFRLQRYAKRSRITWVIDGLFDSMDNPEQKSLLKLIPFGVKDFDFIVTGESDVSLSLGLKNCNPKPVPVFPIGLEEAVRFFSDLNLNASMVHELRCFSSGNIGQMQKLRSFVRSGLSVDDLINDHKPTLESIFEFEWSSIPPDPDIHKILAYIVYSNKPTTLEDLSKFLSKPIAHVKDVVNVCKILSSSEQSELVSIESRAQRGFVRARLSQFESTVRSHIITTLLSDPETRDATLYLPSELLTAGKHDELISHLGPKHFLNLLENERSLRSIRLHAGYGIRAASIRENKTAELSLSLIRSTATGLTFSIGFDSQIEALVKLGAFDQALELASMAATSEERLHLLSIAASTIHQSGTPVPSDLKDQIRVLTTELSSEDLGDLGIEIACNLLPVDFDIATDILREVLDAARKRIDNSRHESTPGVLNGSMGALDRGNAEAKRSLDLLSQDQAKRFSEAVAKTVDKFSIEKIRHFIKPIGPANKIMVLARWIGQNRQHQQAFEIAEQALDLVLSEVSRAPRLQDLREIAEILPYIENLQKRELLTEKIETQIDLLGHQGTSEEYIRLRLLIYRVRFEKDPDEIELQLIDLFAEVDQLTESSVQVTCWTWMLFQLSQFNGLEQLEKDVPIMAEVTAKLSTAIDKFLNGTANHFAVARPAIAALAQTKMEEAEKLVSRLNTEVSRDKGYAELAKNIQLSTLSVSDLEIVSKCILQIVDDRVRNDAICSLLNSIVLTLKKTNLPPVLSTVGHLWESIRVASIKLQAYVLTFLIQFAQNHEGLDLNSIMETQNELWDDILGDTARVEIGFWIASVLATDHPASAREWLQRTIKFADQATASSVSVSSALASTISMASRVLPYMEVTDADISRIRSLINEVKEDEIRLRLWTQLGIRLFFAGKELLAKEIIKEIIEPVLNQTYRNNGLILDSMVEFSAPLLYLTHPATAILAISKIGCKFRQESSLVNICDVLLRRLPANEPIDTRNSIDYQINQSTINDILNVLKDIRNDSAISYVVEDLCYSISSDKNRSVITRNGALNSLNSLQSIVNSKLPDPVNIKHDGYLIVCTAHILRARSKVASNVKKDEWASLYQKSRNISNVADRVIVTAIVGSCAVNSKASSEVVNWVEEIRADLAQIPSDQDRIDRHDWVAKTVGTADKASCRALVSDALKLIVQLPETDDILRRQRSLMDLANTLDTKLADHLIALNDADEARQERLRIEKVRQLQRLALTQNPAADEVGKLSDHELADTCRDSLGRLNAQRISPRSIEEFRYIQERASKMPIRLAASIWHYVLESSLQKRKRDRNTEFAQQLFDATCKASEVVCGLIGRGLAGSAQTKALEVGIIRNGDREIFIEKVSVWAKDQVGQVIKISDPYFGPEDIQVIKTIESYASDATYFVLTSREHIKKKKLSDVAEAFENAWLEISDEKIPEITIVVIGLGSEGKHPIHDRWIVSSVGGLRLGTSAHSMGGLRTSEISNLSTAEVESRLCEINAYLDSPPREIHGERLVIAKYSL